MGQEINMNKPLFLRAADRERSKRRAQYRYKTTEHVQNRKHKRDMDGFFIPFAMFRPYNGSGLLCEVLGLTPARRMADLRVLQDYLMKEAYEHEIEMLMCQMRLHEFAFHRRFCTEDRAEERYTRITGAGDKSGAEVDAPEMTAPDTRQVILNAVTWRYDWIQRYKKPCFQFAEAVIDCKMLSEDKRDAVLKRRGVSLAAQERLMAEFIREAAAMPEPNLKLVDFMYEAAWRILFEYRYDRYILTEKARKSAGVLDEEVGDEELEKIRAEAEAARKAKEEAAASGLKPRKRKKQQHPESWGDDSFGEPYAQHKDRLQLPRLNQLDDGQLTMDLFDNLLDKQKE